MNQELVINLWAMFDASTGLVYGLSGRAYNATGTDSEKLILLKRLSATDYITAKRYKVPSRFQITYSDGSTKKEVTQLNAVYDPNAQLFEEIFKNIESELPPLQDFTISGDKPIIQKVPDDPLCVTTVLYENEDGVIRPIITDEDREWVMAQEKRIHGN